MKSIVPFLVAALLLLSLEILAQGKGNCDPDSLQKVTKNGWVSLQVLGNQTQYLLDEDGDGINDFILNFGPFWYIPDEGSALRPMQNDSVEIEGGLNTISAGALPVIVVYGINGEFWRNPYDPFWNNINNHYHSNHQGGMGFAPGWSNSHLEDTTVSGHTIIDTTLVYNKYYLDIDNDGTPDFHLNFGPYWYEPGNGAVRPLPGDPIIVEGLYHTGLTLPNIMVLELNGTQWRDTAGLGPGPTGRWIHKNMMSQRRIHCILDTACYITIPNGWHGGGMMNDSLFGQMLQLMHQNMIQYQNQNGFMGFEVGLFNGNEQNMMQQNMWRMNFQNQVQYHLRYSQQLINRYRKDESTVQIRRWNNQNQNWEQVNGASYDTQNNLVTFSDSQVDAFYMLTADQLTEIPQYTRNHQPPILLYPNPAVDYITIKSESVALPDALVDILSISGRVVYASKVNNAGEGEEIISVSHLWPGFFILRLTTKEGISIQKFIKN